MQNSKPSSFSKEGIEPVLEKLRAIVADPHATDQDTASAKRALAFFGENGKLPELESRHSQKESAGDEPSRDDKLLPLTVRFATLVR